MPPEFLLKDHQHRQQPQEKIRGSQFVKREEKVRPIRTVEREKRYQVSIEFLVELMPEYWTAFLRGELEDDKDGQ